jgi:CubicO group peptidase (beta-lactamase class C family)
VRSLIFGILSCLLVSAGLAQTKPADQPKPAQSIEELRRQPETNLHDTRRPGLAVAIVRHDGPERVAGLGRADMAEGRGATEATLFRIGSVSRGFVALSILMLVGEDKLSLDDSVGELAPEIWFENPREASDPVRVPVRWHALAVVPALLVATAYLAYRGLVGFRIWA